MLKCQQLRERERERELYPLTKRISSLITHLVYDFIYHSKYSKIRLKQPQTQAEHKVFCSYAELNYARALRRYVYVASLRMTLVWSKFNYVVLWNLYDNARQHTHKHMHRYTQSVWKGINYDVP